jgi:hypothetical protein
MGEAQEVREYAYHNYVLPARAAKASTTSFSAGPIHKALGFQDLMPCVCGAIDTKIFTTDYKVELLKRTGPKYGPNATWIFRV